MRQPSTRRRVSWAGNAIPRLKNHERILTCVHLLDLLHVIDLHRLSHGERRDVEAGLVHAQPDDSRTGGETSSSFRGPAGKIEQQHSEAYVNLVRSE